MHHTPIYLYIYLYILTYNLYTLLYTGDQVIGQECREGRLLRLSPLHRMRRIYRRSVHVAIVEDFTSLL